MRLSASMPLSVLLTCATVLAGCLDASSDEPTDRSSDGLVTIPRVEWDHDHADPAGHVAMAVGVHEISQVRYATDGVQASFGLFPGGRMVAVGTLVFVVFVREDARTGLAVIDVSDPARMELLGTYRSDYGASEGEGLAVTPDGKTAFLTVETQFSTPQVPPAIEVIDVSDPRNPRLADRVFTVDQPHVLSFVEIKGAGYLVVSSYEPTMTVAETGLAPGLGAPSAAVSLYTYRPNAPRLTPAGRYVFGPDDQTADLTFAHDPVEIEHPLTHEQLLYLGAFGSGGLILSLEDPMQLQKIGQATDRGEASELRWHSFNPGPAIVDGILPTAAVPFSYPGDGPAYLSIYDTADPTHPTLLGQWHDPNTAIDAGGNPPSYLHVPVFVDNGTRLLVPHHHAGLLVFDASTGPSLRDLEPIAFWIPAATPTQGALYAASIVMAVQVGNAVFATEAISGTLYSLALDS